LVKSNITPKLEADNVTDFNSIEKYAAWVETQKIAGHDGGAHVMTKYEQRLYWISKLRTMVRIWNNDASQEKEYTRLELGIL